MAITKQINQLNNAGEIQSSDYVALAQSGQSEATKATISDLAAAVGELNSTGALAELELATSLGKNLLAQRLTEKGQTCSPSDTLISMADKVNNLEVTGASEQIIKCYMQNADATSEQGTRFAYANLPTAKAMVAYIQGILYYIPKENNSSTNISELQASALFSLDLGFGAVGGYLTVNMTEDYVAFSTALNTYHIYSIGSNAFTFVKTVTTTTSRTSGTNFIINNAATKLGYRTANNKITIYDLTTETEVELTTPSDYISNLNRGFMDESHIWFINSRSSGMSQSEYGFYQYIHFQDSGDNNLSVLDSSEVSIQNGECVLLCVNKSTVLCFSCTISASSQALLDNKYKIPYVTYNLYFTPADFIPFNIYQGCSYNSYSSNSGHYVMWFDYYDSYDVQTDTLTFSFDTMVSPIVIDLTNRVVSGNSPYNIYRALTSGTLNYYTSSLGSLYEKAHQMLVRNKNTKTCLCTAGYYGVDVGNANNKYIYHVTLTENPQFYGFIRNINGQYMSYIMSGSTIGISDVNNGVLSVETTKVYLEEDSDESI